MNFEISLEEKLKQLPSSAGVYQYFDASGHLLYIGKAKNLKNRVKSYFKFTPNLQAAPDLSPRIYKMICETKALEWIVLPNENEALILENSLIKQLKPKYNVLLRDDKTYPYIFVDLNEDFPRLEITRKIEKGKNIKYFGPYSSGAKDILDTIYEIVPLVQKKSCINGKKACLFHQIGKCLAPCEGKITKEEYKKILDEALLYIYNKSKLLFKLEDKMNFYSSEFRFEEALVLRDRIKTIEKSQIKSSIDLATNEDIDIFSVAHKNEKAVVVKMFLRDGKIASSIHDFIKILTIEDEKSFDYSEIYKRAIINYYKDDLPIVPKEILISDALENEDIEELEEYLKNRFNKRVKITNPKIDKKKTLCDVAKNNAFELLRIEFSKEKSTIYSEIKELFSLNTLPYIIETFDNSHMMGQARVGGMVVYKEELENFSKQDYRHYNLESLDEYSQMRELLSKRAESFIKNPAPDLWIIDGGSTLLNLAFMVSQSVGINLDIIAISKEKIDAKAHRAKGKANDILHFRNKDGQIESLKLLNSDKRLQFVQKLRDEAHRFAISFHKKQKRKEDKEISLHQITGIGPAKIKKLLLYFGEFEKIKNASFEELKEVLNQKDAQNIVDYFQKD